MDRYHDPALDYISDLDFDAAHPNIATTDPFDPFPASPFPATPSYAGSYQNSPYSGASDLHDFDQKDDALGLFPDNDPLVISRDDYARGDYDPAAYDDPSSAGLLMFDNDFMTNGSVSLSVTPADDPSPAHSPAMYDHSSPASSAGRADSPASSVSSHPHSGGSHHTNAPNPSPRLNFDTLRVDSPFMPNQQLPSSPPNKPQSPPQLLIPEGQEQAPPMINAPEGDGSVGPRLHIVPATPVGGGDPNQTHSNPFGQGSQQSASTAWQHDPSTSNASQSSSYQPSFTFPAERPLINTGGNSGLPSSADDFLLPPSPSRVRSKSDTSARPSQWLGSSMSLLPQNALDDRTHTVNLGDVLPPVSDLDRRHHQPAYASGPGLAPPGFGGPQGFGLQNNGLLSPDFNALRRAKSDAGRMTHRQVRSEDLRSSGLSFPPSTHQDFIRAAQTGPATQFLHPAEALPSVARVAGGHHRSASSGSRERGWGGSHSARASPYPSPSASPARLAEPLPPVGGMGGMYDMGMGMGMGGGMEPQYMSAGVSRASTPAAVAKPNVTTTATADASMKRRINDAKFVCTVPGCGSTFTRHFNLKGHMRSHNDEKPFQCKWPGCGKGFARQHDCKRHEQLHSNHRPFTCEGCKKPFARLDALNRHLRSEGGAGCAKMQEGAGGEGMEAHQAPPELSLPGKMEPDVNGWGNPSFAGIVM